VGVGGNSIATATGAVAVGVAARAIAVNSVAIGYTDRFGSVAHNRDLSRRRAQAVADALKQRGVDPVHFDVRGAGATAPVVMCAGAKKPAVIACLAPNRRVEIRVSGQAAASAPDAGAQRSVQAAQTMQPPPHAQLQPQQAALPLAQQSLQLRKQWQMQGQLQEQPPAPK
jgi:hypothetical protein